MKSQKIRILLLEDNPDDVHFIKKSLAGINSEIKTLQNGLEGYEYILSNHEEIDVILLDNRLPQLNGIEILSKLKTKKISHASIVLTVDTKIETAVEAMKSGALDFLPKSSKYYKDLPDKVIRIYEIQNNKREKQRIEKDLALSEANLKAIVENTLFTFLLLDVDLRIKEMNHLAYRKIKKLKKSAPQIGDNIIEILGSYAPIWNEVFEETLKGKVVNKVIHVKDMYLEINCLPVKENGSITGISYSSIDVTENQKYKKALSDSEEKYRLLFNSANDAVFVHNLPKDVNSISDFLEVNDTACRLLDYKREELLKLNFKDIDVSVSDRTPEMLLEQLLDKGKTNLFERKLMTKNGNIVYAEMNSQIFSLRNEKLVISIARDITERKKIESELNDYRNHLEKLVNIKTKELKITNQWLTETNNALTKEIEHRKKAEHLLKLSEEQYRLLTESSTDLITKHDAKGNTTYISPVLTSLAGYIPEKLVGSSPFTRVHPEDKEAVMQNLKKILYTDEKLSSIYRFKKINNEYTWFETSCKKITNSKGEIEIICVSRDISERVRTQEQLVKALEKEKELNELRTRFVSTVSHEFRTPLTTIYSNTQLLELYGKKWDDEKRAKSFSRVYESIANMTTMLNEVSILSKDHSGKMQFKPEEINIKDFLEKTIEELLLINSKKIHIAKKINIKNPVVTMDSKLLRHIFSNVLSNAIKYSGKSSRINFTVEDKGNEELNATIEDFGIGIPQNDLQKLFEPFHRASNVETIKGTGLGMSIVKRCIEIHNGTIKIESQQNKGTKVKLTIPYKTKLYEKNINN